MIKVAILAINNTVSGCLDQYISIIGKKYYIDFDIDVFVKIEEMLRVIDKEKNYYDIIGLDTKMKASMVLMATLDGNTKTLLPVSELPCILSLIQ